MSTPARDLRIGDADREQAMADLALHYTDGRLDHEDYDERLDAIWTARTQGDLQVIFADLPRPQVSYPKPVTRVPGSRRRRLPLLPVLALLVVLSMLTEAPLWLLIFPLMFVKAPHRGGCEPARGHADYRRAGRTHGW